MDAHNPVMAGTLAAEEADAFRATCNDFLVEHATEPARSVADAKVFLAAVADAGLGGIV